MNNLHYPQPAAIQALVQLLQRACPLVPAVCFPRRKSDQPAPARSIANRRSLVCCARFRILDDSVLHHPSAKNGRAGALWPATAAGVWCASQHGSAAAAAPLATAVTPAAAAASDGGSRRGCCPRRPGGHAARRGCCHPSWHGAERCCPGKLSPRSVQTL